MLWQQSFRTSLNLKLTSSVYESKRTANQNVLNLFQWEKLVCLFRWKLSDHEASQHFKYPTSWDFADFVVKNKSLITLTVGCNPNEIIATCIPICFPEALSTTSHLDTVIICYPKIWDDQAFYEWLRQKDYWNIHIGDWQTFLLTAAQDFPWGIQFLLFLHLILFDEKWCRSAQWDSLR